MHWTFRVLLHCSAGRQAGRQTFLIKTTCSYYNTFKRSKAGLGFGVEFQAALGGCPTHLLFLHVSWRTTDQSKKLQT
jgi:hypothetical protein